MLYLNDYTKNKFICFNEDWSFVDLSLEEFKKEDIAYRQILGGGLTSVPLIEPEWVLPKTKDDVVAFANKSKNTALKQALAGGDSGSVYLSVKGDDAFYISLRFDNIISTYPHMLFVTDGGVFKSISIIHSYEDHYEVVWRHMGFGSFRKQVIGVDDVLRLDVDVSGMVMYDNSWYYVDLDTSGHLAIHYDKILTTGLELI